MPADGEPDERREGDGERQVDAARRVERSLAPAQRRDRNGHDQCCPGDRPGHMGVDAIEADADQKEVAVVDQQHDRAAMVQPDIHGRDEQAAHGDGQQAEPLRPAQHAERQDQRHTDVEHQLVDQRPIRHVHGLLAQQARRHGEVGEELRHRRRVQHWHGRHDADHGGDEQGGQEGRHQSCCARDRELPDGLLAFDRHQDHEAADDEEELDAEVAGPEVDGQRDPPRVEHVVVLPVVVKHHCRGCKSAQHIKPGDAFCAWSHLWSPLKLSVVAGG